MPNCRPFSQGISPHCAVLESAFLFTRQQNAAAHTRSLAYYSPSNKHSPALLSLLLATHEILEKERGKSLKKSHCPAVYITRQTEWRTWSSNGCVFAVVLIFFLTFWRRKITLRELAKLYSTFLEQRVPRRLDLNIYYIISLQPWRLNCLEVRTVPSIQKAIC